jgi:hypothetical protein
MLRRLPARRMTAGQEYITAAWGVRQTLIRRCWQRGWRARRDFHCISANLLNVLSKERKEPVRGGIKTPGKAFVPFHRMRPDQALGSACASAILGRSGMPGRVIVTSRATGLRLPKRRVCQLRR